MSHKCSSLQPFPHILEQIRSITQLVPQVMYAPSNVNVSKREHPHGQKLFHIEIHKQQFHTHSSEIEESSHHYDIRENHFGQQNEVTTPFF